MPPAGGVFICRSKKILGFLITAAIRSPKRTLALVLVLLAALASTLSYAGFLVVGVVADHLGTGRGMAGLLLAGLFARFPWIRQRKLRIAGVLPKPARRPLIVSLLAFCLWDFLSRGEALPAAVTGFAGAFALTYPWLRRALVARMRSSVFNFPGKHASNSIDDRVIDGEFREKRD